MRLYNSNANLIQVIENLYNKATSAVYLNGDIGDRFRTTVGVRQGCLLSPTLFNIFLERIMTDALEDHQGTVSIGGRTITNLRFADDIDGLAGKEEELESLVDRLDKNSAAFGMEICAETIWSDKHISLSSKIRLMRSIVISVLLYACETWTLTADILKKL